MEESICALDCENCLDGELGCCPLEEEGVDEISQRKEPNEFNSNASHAA